MPDYRPDLVLRQLEWNTTTSSFHRTTGSFPIANIVNDNWSIGEQWLLYILWLMHVTTLCHCIMIETETLSAFITATEGSCKACLHPKLAAIRALTSTLLLQLRLAHAKGNSMSNWYGRNTIFAPNHDWWINGSISRERNNNNFSFLFPSANKLN